MNIEMEAVEPLTDIEIDQLRELSAHCEAVRLGNRELRALVASLDRLQVLEQQNAELRQSNDMMLRDQPLSPTVEIAHLRDCMIRLAECVRTSRPDLAYGVAADLRKAVR